MFQRRVGVVFYRKLLRKRCRSCELFSLVLRWFVRFFRLFYVWFNSVYFFWRFFVDLGWDWIRRSVVFSRELIYGKKVVRKYKLREQRQNMIFGQKCRKMILRFFILSSRVVRFFLKFLCLRCRVWILVRSWL